MADDVELFVRGAGAKTLSPASATNPLPVATPTAAPRTGQKAVAVTGTAVALAASSTLVNGLVVKADSGNTGSIFVGPAGVNTTDDGTGTGYKLEAGEAMSFAVSDPSLVFINGTAGDHVFWGGN